MPIEELRLHGMSGTPPRELLYTDPVTYDRSDSHVKVWTKHDDARDFDVNVRAFHWGSLTSGNKITAFWILLTPFVFANVSGWMQENNDETLWSKSQTSLIRVAGLGLTGLFVAQIGALIVGLTHALAAPYGLHARTVGIGGLVLGFSFLVMIWALSTRSQVRPLKLGDQVSLIFGSADSDLLPPEKRHQPHVEAQWEDPAPGARLTTPEMWDTHGVLHRLRRVHLAFGFLVAALVLEAGLTRQTGNWRIWLISALLALHVLSALVITAGVETSSGSLNLALIKVATGLAAGVWLGVVWPLLELPVVSIPVGVIAALGLWIFLTEMSDQAVSLLRRFGLSLIAFSVAGFGLAVSGSAITMPTTSTWPNIHRVVLVQATLTGAALLAYYATGVIRRPSPERGRGERLWRPLVPIGALALALFIGASLGIAVAVSAEYAATNLLGEASPFANTSMIDHEDLDPTQRSILISNEIDTGSYKELQEALGPETGNSDRLCAASTCISPEVRWSVSRFDISKTDVVSNGGDWVAVAMLGFVSGIVAVCGVMMSLGGKAQRQGAMLTVLRRVTRRAHVLFASIGAIGVVFAAIQIWDLSVGDPAWDPAALSSRLTNSILSLVVGVLAAIAVVTISVGLSRANRAIAGLVLITGSAVVYLVWRPGLDYYVDLPLVGLPIDLLSSVDISILLTALVPAFLILRSILGGIGDPASRRKVGMLWDTGSFWPRWFHPLGPTAYGPAVMDELREQLAAQPPDVLAAHSQGSVIATVTISQSSHKPISFLTYGSPLGIIYSKVFPSAGVADLVREVQRDMAYAHDGRSTEEGHWINLWRDTDPLGGEAIPGLAVNRRIALKDDHEEGTGHSQYELTKAYVTSRVDALMGVHVPSGEDD